MPTADRILTSETSPSCAVAGCDRPSRTRGWCGAHFERLRSKGDVLAHIPLRLTGRATKCHPERTHLARGLCAPCYQTDRLARLPDQRRKAQDRNRRANLKRYYGLTVDVVEAMYVAQQGRCAVCGDHRPLRGNDGLAIDHDHRTGKVRGLLCPLCNKAIGLMRDDPDLLRSAAAYLGETV